MKFFGTILLFSFQIFAAEAEKTIEKIITKPPLVRRERFHNGIPFEQIIRDKRPRIVIPHPAKQDNNNGK